MTTSRNERRLKVRNVRVSFRELLRQERASRADKKLEALLNDWWYFEARILLDRDNRPFLSPDELRSFANMRDVMVKSVNRLTKKLYESPDYADHINALSDIITAARDSGSLIGLHPIKRKLHAVKAAAAKVPWWHETTLTRAAEIRKKHPSYNTHRVASDVYEKLKTKLDGPKSLDAVYKVLRRKLWTTGECPTK